MLCKGVRFAYPLQGALPQCRQVEHMCAQRYYHSLELDNKPVGGPEKGAQQRLPNVKQIPDIQQTNKLGTF